jgi:DNA-binding transcriptional MerR regulator
MTFTVMNTIATRSRMGPSPFAQMTLAPQRLGTLLNGSYLGFQSRALQTSALRLPHRWQERRLLQGNPSPLITSALTLTLGEAAHLIRRVVRPDDEGVSVEEISIGEFARRSRLSPKALRLYDELAVLVPSRVDEASGYRYYDIAQLDEARLIVMLRQLQLPLATIKELLACDPADAASRIAAHWREADAAHDARRELADHLVNRLSGKRSIMYDVATREMPARSLLCLKRNVDEQGAWTLGKEFIAILRERPLPRLDGREGAFFSIYWGEVSADSDGPVEWCRPVPGEDATALASQYPELTLRTEPAHREAFVALRAGRGGIPGVQMQLASEALRAWAQETGLNPESLTLKPEDLGMRISYLASGPVTETSVPDCDVAVPFA